MSSDSTQGPKVLADTGKGRQLLLTTIRKQIEKGTGKSIAQLREENPEDRYFYLAAHFVITTKKALCEATGIPVEAACRYKRHYEMEGLLKQSTADVICPLTKHPARLISTDPKAFPDLDNSNQLKLF